MVKRSGVITTNRAGTGRFGCIVQLVLVGGLFYIGAQLAEDGMAFYRLRDAMMQEARFVPKRSDQQIRDRLRAFTDSVKLPAAAKEINIVRDDNRIRIWSEYDQEIKLPFGRGRTIHFRPSAEKTF